MQEWKCPQNLKKESPHCGAVPPFVVVWARCALMASNPQGVELAPPTTKPQEDVPQPWTERMVTIATISSDDSKPANLKDIHVKPPEILLKPPTSHF